MQQMRDDLSMVSVAEAARTLGRDTTTIQRWARTGRLPVAFRMPGATGALLFRREDVEALAAGVKADAA